MSQPVVQDTQNQLGSPDYKAKLDEAATRAKSPPKEEQNTGILEKVSQYVPVVGKVLGGQEQESERGPSPTGKNVSGPPERPHHDTQIEEFIKDQHRSKKVVGIEEPTAT